MQMSGRYQKNGGYKLGTTSRRQRKMENNGRDLHSGVDGGKLNMKNIRIWTSGNNGKN